MRSALSALGALAALMAIPRPVLGSGAEAHASLPIRARLLSSFAAPPLLFEIAEAISMHNSSAYFPFLLKLAENSSVFDGSDADAYKQAMLWIKQESLLEPFAQSLVQLEISAHAHAPAVVAQYQHYTATVVPEIKNARGDKHFDDSCAVWAQYKDKQACSVEALGQMLDIEKFYGDTYVEEAKVEPVKLAFDHVYAPESAQAPKIVALYADPRAEGFVAMHSHLKTLADNGEITYILRYRPWNTESADPDQQSALGLSGYGVELALKSTEYKVIDDRDLGDASARAAAGPGSQKLSAQGTNGDSGAAEYELFASKAEPVVKGLPEKLISDLGIQALQMVLAADGSNKLSTLRQLVQNLPRYAHLLAEVPVNNTLADQIKQSPFESTTPALSINGLELDSSDIDPFIVLEHLCKENSILAGLESLGISQSQAIDLLFAVDSGSADSDTGRLAFDMRDKSTDKKVIMWLNDLEKDRRYASWPTDLQALKRIIAPGMIQRIGRNIVQVIFALDFADPESWVLVLEDLLANVEHGLPMQFGVVPLVDYDTTQQEQKQEQSASNTMARFMLYLRREFKRKEWHSIIKGSLISHIQATRGSGAKPATFVESTQTFYAAYIKTHTTKDSKTPLSWDQIVDIDNADDDNAWLSRRWADTVGYCTRLDLSPSSAPSGLVFVNGEQYLMGSGFQKNVFNAFQTQTWELAQKLRSKEITPDIDIQEYVYGTNAAASRNTLVYVSDENPLRILPLSQPSVSHWIDSNVKYIGGAVADSEAANEQVVSTWVVGNFASQRVRQVAASALSAARQNSHMRVALIHVPLISQKPDTGAEMDGEYHNDEEAEGYDPDAPQIVYQLSGTDVGVEAVIGYLRGSDVSLLELDEKHSALFTPLGEYIDDAEVAFAANQEIMLSLDAVPDDIDSCRVVVNGRIIPTLSPSMAFTQDSFTQLVAYETKERIGPMRDALAKVVTDSSKTDMPLLLLKASAAVEYGKTLFAANSILQSRKKQSRTSLAALQSDHTSAHVVVNEPSSARIRIQASFDPLSEIAQKWTPILETLTSLPDVSLELWLTPQSKMSELPIKRFYRYLWPSKPDFDNSGKISSPEVMFNGIPADPLLTLGMDVPSAWLVTAVESVHDLDNIRLSSLKASTDSGISAVYKLVNILVEGHLVDTSIRSPARGLEVQLGTALDKAMTDTIVMANLGYLQLKANPGVWRFSIRSGRSADIYKIDHIGEGRWNYAAAKQTGPDQEDRRPVVVTSFRGTTIFPLVSKRAGKEKEDVLEDSNGAGSNAKRGSDAKAGGSSGGLWGKLRGSFGSSSDVGAAKDSRPHFDVFAVASGHLYERLMSIMIKSVLNNTESHVKFWLIENFLSPSFKAFVPHMAEEFGFDFEFVTYKWPHWLNHETEKQRTIWGYKILFLDVLFPLSLDRVIFVDADQIVRADLQELADMDLQGAPYGYTPFCDDRKEIDGYRFWKNGWWKDHLRGKPYHISALYVVDLKRFRQLAAGDRLRGQYQMLSRDPSSLANLDQDLPNNMQHQVPIFSLPQEWLWCETWCSDASLSKAKTIDLCNNPMTKEPKLERARRLLPEWEVYDKQIANFTKILAQRGQLEGAQIADAEAVNIDNSIPEISNEESAAEENAKHDEL
ncbi:killer toxin resistant protein [Coemansia sp. Benny D115]|nr:killer toxin resistant protein [Coemansia sp. Benny D115]